MGMKVRRMGWKKIAEIKVKIVQVDSFELEVLDNFE